MIIAVSLALQVLTATQVYPRFSPNVLESSDVFGPQNFKSLTIELSENAANGTFEFTESRLAITVARGPDDLAWTIFDVSASMNVAFEPSLGLEYSVLSYGLNVTSDSVRIYLRLVNGTHTIMLFYVVGFTTSDLMPDPTADNYSYVFCQVGSQTDTQFTGERNPWTDLTDKGVILDRSWRIVKIALGIQSNPNPSVGSDHRVEGFFDIAGNSIFYENLTYATVYPVGEQPSWPALVLMFVIALICSAVSYMALRPQAKIKNAPWLNGTPQT